MRRIGFDTGIIVDCAQDREYSNKTRNKWQLVDNILIVSTRVIDESTKLLTDYPFYWNKGEAISKIKNSLNGIGIKPDPFKENLDIKEGWKLTKFFGVDGCHPPDNFIMAHYIRIGINVVLSTNWHFCDIAKKLGMKAVFIQPL
jgi:hypothetical protein